MPFRALIILVTALFASGCSLFGFEPAADASVSATVVNTDQAVEQFLAGRDLDAIEGAWQHDENAFEVVIARNDFDVAADYDFVGIITQSDQPAWHNGDIKIMLRRTNDAGVYEGVWLTRNKLRREMTFVVETRNLIQGSFVSNDGNTYFARIRRINPRFAAAR